jgi:hypothetical protein
VIIPGATYWERTQWPRAETEITFEQNIGTLGMFKVFANGMWQEIYQREGDNSRTLAGVGGGGRVEVGPVHLGLAGHYGKGVGVGFALHPADSFFHPAHPARKFRTMDGLYAQLMVSPLKTIDVMAGAGMTEVQLLPEDKIDYIDDDASADSDGDGLNETTMPSSARTIPRATCRFTGRSACPEASPITSPKTSTSSSSTSAASSAGTSHLPRRTMRRSRCRPFTS